MAASTVQYLAYQNGSALGDIPLDQIGAFMDQPNSFVWLRLHEPDEDLLRKIQQVLDLHHLASEVFRQGSQRSKLQLYGNALALALRTAKLENQPIRFGEASIVLDKSFIISLRRGPSSSYERVREQIEAGIVRNTASRDSIDPLYDMQRQLMLLRRTAIPLREICNRLISIPKQLVSGKMAARFRDVHDRTAEVVEGIGQLIDMHAVAVQANLSLISIRQNDVMRKLSA